MGIRLRICVLESASELKSRRARCAVYLRPRVKLQQLVASGVSSTKELSARTGISDTTIRIYKRKYADGGIDALLAEGRGGDKRSGISVAQKQKIAQKLSDPKNGLRSYGEAQAWLKAQPGIEKEYQALNKYLKRNFGTKLKVGRKSHVQ